MVGLFFDDDDDKADPEGQDQDEEEETTNETETGAETGDGAQDTSAEQGTGAEGNADPDESPPTPDETDELLGQETLTEGEQVAIDEAEATLDPN